MFHRNVRIDAVRALGVLAGLALSASPSALELHAQKRDFLLGTPKASLSLRAGLSMPRAGSGNGGVSLWDDIRDQLEISAADLRGVYVGADLGIRASEHVDVVFTVGHTSSATQSEFRRWRDEDDVPITQVTEFTTTPVTAGVKLYLMPRGRAVGRYAWIPRTLNPYAGIAGGIVRYRFEQHGDFVDYETLDIFSDRFWSVATGATAHLFTGVDIGVNNRMMFTGEVRYGFAKAPLNRDFFRGFADLDLTGLQISGGLSFRL